MKDRVLLIVLAIANIGLVFYGLSALLSPGILYEPYTAHVFQFPSTADLAVNYQKALFRLLGHFNLIVGAGGLFLAYRYQVDKQQWLLRLVFIITFLAYLGPVVFDNTVGSINFFEIIEHLILAVILFVGIFVFIGRQKT